MATALDLYAPFDDGPGANATEDTWRRIMRRVGAPGVIRNIGSEARVFADSTGLQVKVDAFEAWIEGHWGSIAATKTLPIATPHGSLPRHDLVVVRANYLENRLELEVLTGTPAGTPVPPTPVRNTSVFDVPIGLVWVPAGAVTITAGNVLSLRSGVGGAPVAPEADDYLLYGDKLSNIRRRDITSVTHNSLASGDSRVVRMVPTRRQVATKLRFVMAARQIGGNPGQAGIFKGWDQSFLYPVMTFTPDFFVPGGFTTPFVRETTLPSSLEIFPGESVAVVFHASGSTTQSVVFGAHANPTVDTSNIINPDTSESYVTMVRSGNYTAVPHLNMTTAGGWTKAWYQPWIAFA